MLSTTRFFRCFFYILFAVLAAYRPAFSWDATGHMLIAQIAYNTLPRDVTTRLNDKLAKLPGEYAPYNFVTAAAWMDDIKRDPAKRWKAYNALHYVDIPYSTTGKNAVIPQGRNIVSALHQLIATQGKSTFTSGNEAIELAMLMHLVGDIHEPLHCVDRNDRGGNDVAIAGLPVTPYSPKNLHAFWDTAYRYDAVKGKILQRYYGISPSNRPRQFTQGAVATLAKELLRKYPPQNMPGSKNLDINAWAKESYGIACTLAYAPVTGSRQLPVVLTPAYVVRSRGVAEKQLVIAGLRLGQVLRDWK